GDAFWLADGFHRTKAVAVTGAKIVSCDIRKGTVRDAILFACGANLHHGLRRTNRDKRRAVERLLADEEWAKFRERKIADICGVPHPFVADMRTAQLETVSSSNRAEKRIGRDGKSRPTKRSAADPADKSAEREPGDDTEAIQAEAQKRKQSGREVIPAAERS